MKRLAKQIFLIVLAVLLAGELAFLGFQAFAGAQTPQPSTPQTETSGQALEQIPSAPTAAPTAALTEIPTEAPTESETQPRETRYLLTFTGDCTLGSTAEKWNYRYGFVKTIGENYDHPFANVRQYFEGDDFTIINLEGPLTDGGAPASKEFVFRGSPAYTQIMTGSSVEAVTLANNHSQDYGQTGYNNTIAALTEAGITYVERDKTALYTTESGLTIGLYAASFTFSESGIRAAVSQLRSQGAEIVICAYHWGTENSYRTNGTQEYFGRLSIEAGADIVWGHHPHVLQKIEHYGDGVIFYSLGNFSFGGAVYPKDYDSAFLQQEVIRDADGSVRLGELTIIPVCVSSASDHNNFQPTPLKPDDPAYDRVMSKLDGTFNGPDLPIGQGKTETTAPTEKPAAPATEPSPQPTAPAVSPTESGAGSGGSAPEGGESGDGTP